MTSGADPWWASGSDESEAAAVDPDELVTAHRRARRGTPDADDDGHDGGGRDPAGHSHEICGVCPICTGMRVLSETRPELAAHLTEAARHLTAAARTLLDEERSRRRPGPDPDEPLTRIDLD